MAAHWRDVTLPLRPETVVWPGDPAFEIEPLRRIADGGACNTSRLSMATHTGTHIDAPWHFEDDGKRLDEVDTSLFFGEALLLDIPDVDTVRASDLGAARLPRRVLLKTRNSLLPVDTSFRADYVALDAEAAQRIVDDGVRLVGVDYLSVAPFRQNGQETHHRLLTHDVLIVEGLCLGGLQAGIYQFTVLPLALVGADGAPCRAFVGPSKAGADQ
jgi:arylformamidase